MSVETMDFLAMLSRLIRAAGKRVADADEIELARLMDLRTELDEVIAASVRGQRSIGRSWASVAAATGTTRQAAHKRYREKS